MSDRVLCHRLRSAAVRFFSLAQAFMPWIRGRPIRRLGPFMGLLWALREALAATRFTHTSVQSSGRLLPPFAPGCIPLKLPPRS